MARTIICDFDGVWVDSFGILLGINQAALAGRGKTISAEQYRLAFHGPIHHMLREQLGLDEAQQHEFSEAKRRMFPARYHSGSVPFFPFAEVLAARLARLGQMHIVTASPAEAVSGLLEQRGLRRHFGEVAGFSLAGKRATLLRLKAAAPDAPAYFVTDTVGDVREAAGLGVQVIGVGWGFHSPAELQAAGAAAVAATDDELVARIEA